MSKIFKNILAGAILFLLGAEVTNAAGLIGLNTAKDKLKAIGTGIYGNNGTPANLETMIGGFIQVGLTIMGVIFLVLMVYAGYRWMTARGEEEEAKKALGTIRMSVIGMVIVVASFGVSNFVIGRLAAFGGLNGAQNMLNTTGNVIYQGTGGQSLPIEVIIGGLIQAALTIIGVLFLILIVYSGYRWMIARDEEEEAKKAMTTIKNSLIGLIIVFGAYAITYFVMYQLLSKTGAIVP